MKLVVAKLESWNPDLGEHRKTRHEIEHSIINLVNK